MLFKETKTSTTYQFFSVYNQKLLTREGRKEERKRERKELIVTKVKRKLSIHRNPKMTQMLEIEDKDLKVVVIYKFSDIK